MSSYDSEACDVTDLCACRISSKEDPNKIPYFGLQGQPHTPEVLSNKIILTPLAPGNQRAAVWSQQTLLREHWIADVDFRANGPDRGGGNLNIWIAKDGPTTVGTSSVYTVGQFDGLALVINSQSGAGGMVRGFLNDGTKDFSKQQHVDELAFGHCSYSYRNLGRPSQIKLRQSDETFTVEIDGKLCFESNKFSIPTGYNMGITAATPDTPDSFEVFKMVVMTDNRESATRQFTNGNKEAPNRARDTYKKDEGNYKFEDELADEDPDIFKTSKTQFMDLHNRLQNTNHQLSSIHRTVSRHQQQDEKRHDELHQLLGDIRADLRKLEEIGELNRRIKDLESELKTMRNDLGKMIHNNQRSVKDYLSDHHSTLSQTVMENAPGHKLLIFVFVGTQVGVVVAYVLYKKRRASMPKKYL